MATLRLAVAALLASCCIAPRAFSFPPMTGPIQVDHGFRYHDGIDQTDGCAFTLDGERLLVTYRGFDGGGIHGSRKSLTGGEIDLAPLCIVGGG